MNIEKNAGFYDVQCSTVSKLEKWQKKYDFNLCNQSTQISYTTVQVWQIQKEILILPIRFYVKSISDVFESHELPFEQFGNSKVWF